MHRSCSWLIENANSGGQNINRMMRLVSVKISDVVVYQHFVHVYYFIWDGYRNWALGLS